MSGAETIEATVDGFLSVWSAPDAASAKRQLDELCDPAVRYHNPVVVLSGTDELASHIGELATLIGSRRLSRTTQLQLAGPWCRYGWALQPPVPGAELSGQTAVELDAAQRIKCVVSFHGQLQSRTFMLGSAW
jgi:hypothetical protein